MLALDTMVQTLKSGTTCRVQDLEPGNLVYNPITDSHSTVADVLYRQITPDLDLSISSSPVLPVRIRAGNLGGDLPTADLITTAAQRILIRTDHQSVAGLQETSAAALCNSGAASVDMVRTLLPFSHYLVLFDQPSIFLANGVMLIGVDINDIDSYRSTMFEQKISDIG